MANKTIVAQLEKNKSDIEKKQEEIRHLKNKERKILTQQRNAEQKIRTRRLIERGAILESINPSILSISNEELKTYLQQVLQTEQAKKLLQSITQSEKLDKSLVEQGRTYTPSTMVRANCVAMGINPQTPLKTKAKT